MNENEMYELLDCFHNDLKSIFWKYIQDMTDDERVEFTIRAQERSSLFSPWMTEKDLK
jgi:hypothetical protein